MPKKREGRANLGGRGIKRREDLPDWRVARRAQQAASEADRDAPPASRNLQDDPVGDAFGNPRDKLSDVRAEGKDEAPYALKFDSRRGNVTERTKARWLREFAIDKCVGAACVRAGISRSRLYEWRKQDKEFAEAWDEVHEHQVDRLESSMLRRAIEGYERPVFQGGKLVGLEVVHHPQLGIFMLGKLRGDKFGDRAVPLMSPEEYARMARAALVAQDEEARTAIQGKAKKE